MSPTIRHKYKYFHSTVQRAKDRRQKLHFCRLPFAVRPHNVKLKFSIITSVSQRLHLLLAPFYYQKCLAQTCANIGKGIYLYNPSTVAGVGVKFIQTYLHEYTLCALFNYSMITQRRQRGRVVQGAGVVIQTSLVQGLHPVTSGICLSVVPSSNPTLCKQPTGLPPANWDF